MQPSTRPSLSGRRQLAIAGLEPFEGVEVIDIKRNNARHLAGGYREIARIVAAEPTMERDPVGRGVLETPRGRFGQFLTILQGEYLNPLGGECQRAFEHLPTMRVLLVLILILRHFTVVLMTRTPARKRTSLRGGLRLYQTRSGQEKVRRVPRRNWSLRRVTAYSAGAASNDAPARRPP
jgi:hypothetical protein